MGIDKISYNMILFSINSVAYYVAEIVNRSMETGEFPTIWKTSLIRPLPKNNKIENFSELRPICLLPVFAKMFEFIVSDILLEFVDNYSIIPVTQSGFRKNHGTATALTNVTTEIATNIDSSKVSCLVLLDFSKAFDLINHDLLVSKLRYYGFSERVCLWFSSYLQPRTQVVELEGARSEPVETSLGVPQGSVLGPLLFNIYTSDLPQQVRTCSVNLYADDTQLLVGFPPEDSCLTMQRVNNDLEEIYKWSTKHGLVLNATKSHYMIIGSNNNRQQFLQYNFTTLHINGSILPSAESARNLGVTFDERLDFQLHVNKKLSFVYAKLRSLYPFKFILPSEIKLMLVEALIFPQLDYCSVVFYHFLSSEYKNKIQLAQNSCIRFVFCVRKFDHVTPTYLANSILKYEQRAVLHFGQFVCKIFKLGCPSYLAKYFIGRQDLHNLNLRNMVRFHIPQHKTAKFRNSFSFQAIQLLNSDVFNLITSSTIVNFKKKYKSCLLQQAQQINT